MFEELVTGRHDSGAYYTPRPIVSFMCREALKGYLADQDTGLSEEAISNFIDTKDTEGIGVSEARRVAAALGEVTVVDPACGSGAYLLGMMQELVELQTTLYNAGVDPRTIYDLKLEIIERNLYGADIDDFAVNIAMLRMWLSLAIDYESNAPEPLPNLDFKIVRGDSLIGPDPSPQNYGDLSQNLARHLNLGDLKAEYMRITGQANKDRLKAVISSVEKQIKSTMGDAGVPDGVVDWHVNFGEVFAMQAGFDIVVANPPYGISINDRRQKLVGNSDSYVHFMKLAGEIAPEGVMAYITPTSWETAIKFKKFRQNIFRDLALETIVNLPYDVFSSAYVDTAITIGKFAGQQSLTFQVANLDKRSELDLTAIDGYLTPVSWITVAQDPSLRIPLLEWATDLYRRILERATPMGELTKSRIGILASRFDIRGQRFTGSTPYFIGQVERYRVKGPNGEAFVAMDTARTHIHEGPRLLTRRIVSRSNRLMSARITEKYVVKKDLYAIKLLEHREDRLVTLLAILNSKLMSFLLLSRSTTATRDDFRQVTLTELRELPIIFPDSIVTNIELDNLVNALENEDDNITVLEKQIDEIVYDLYGVNEEEREAISAWLARSG